MVLCAWDKPIVRMVLCKADGVMNPFDRTFATSQAAAAWIEIPI